MKRSMILLTSAFAAVLASIAADVSADFTKLESHRRNGYTVERWEFYPDDFLAVKAMVLVPDGAKPGRTPAVICMNSGRGSIEHLAGERDPYGTINVDEGRKAYYAVKAGYVAVALALPGVANGCPDDIDSADSRRRFLALLPDSGWTEQRLVDLEVEKCVAFLKANPLVDKSNVSVMGFDDAAVIRNSVKAVPGLKVSETILPDCTCDPPHPTCAKPHLATGRRMMSERDYLPTRPDGRTEWTFAWAMKKLREACRPRGTPAFLKDAESFRKWQREHHAGWKMRYSDPKLECEFKLMKEERRDGYTLRTYEFYPYEGLAVKAMMLFPDGAKPGKTPVVVCLPGSGSSLQGLAGEKGDPYWTRYPVRNKQAWWYAKCGMIGVALDNPGSANDAYDDIWYWKSDAKYKQLLGKLTTKFDGVRLDEGVIIAKEMNCCINFLKKDPLVDRERIAVSGLSRGAQVLYSAIVNPDVKACCYNDFAMYGAARRLAVTRVMSDVVYGDRFGDGSLGWMCVATKHLLLNEGGAYKGNIENVERAYELAGVPENLTVHHYDLYSYPPHRPWDKQDMVEARDYDYEDFYRHNNCFPYDHSFHPESALPWLCRIFYGEWKPSKEVEQELLVAGAERERSPFDVYPPDARRGRKAVGPNDREITDADIAAAIRPDGRTEKLVTWVKMQLDRQEKSR